MKPQKPSVISGVVRDARGRPVAGARVYFTKGPVALSDIATITGSDGSFALSAPAPGKYEIECATDTLPPVRKSITVTAGKEVRTEIKLDQTAQR